jgi:Family of unknown function (DUF5678)
MAKDWTHLFELYRGKWVALADDETAVLAAASTAKAAHAAALKRSETPFLYRVPDTLEAFAEHEVRV